MRAQIRDDQNVIHTPCQNCNIWFSSSDPENRNTTSYHEAVLRGTSLRSIPMRLLSSDVCCTGLPLVWQCMIGSYQPTIMKSPWQDRWTVTVCEFPVNQIPSVPPMSNRRNTSRALCSEVHALEDHEFLLPFAVAIQRVTPQLKVIQ